MWAICEQQQQTPTWRGSTKDLDTTTTLQSVREQSDKDSDTRKERVGGISMQQMVMTLWHLQVTKQTDWFVPENEEE